jgi:hypothetical protein
VSISSEYGGGITIVNTNSEKNCCPVNDDKKVYNYVKNNIKYETNES